jgi:outer membrane lipase/esterase
MKKLAAVLFLALIAPVAASAEPITALYVFGDSLSDQGNAFALTGGFPPPPYAQRASNGPVALERLAQVLGVPLVASELGGTNYAVVGATTGAVQIPGAPPGVTTENLSQITYGLPALAGTSLASQVAEFMNAGPLVDPDGALFMVWGGANDLFLNPTADAATTAVANLGASLAALYGFGARHFLVPNLPDLASAPFAQSLSPQERAGLQALSIGFNTLLAAQLNVLSSLPGIDITAFDDFAFFNGILANPGAFGFTNTTAPCLVGTPPNVSLCADPNAYVFWDTVHPTAAVHQVLGDALADAVAQPVPEPATLTLLSLGVVLTGVIRSRARKLD